jgi:hypothetical protein
MLGNPLRTNNLEVRLLVIIPVAVEKVGFFKRSRKSDDRKCLGDWGKSFVELPDAKQFLRNRGERVFITSYLRTIHFPDGKATRCGFSWTAWFESETSESKWEAGS